MLLYEAEEAFCFDELSIRTGLRGIIAVMRAIDMLPRGSREEQRTTVFRADTSKWVRAPISGMVTTIIPVGKSVKKGDFLGLIADPFGENEQAIYAPFAGLIVGRMELPLVYQGDALFHIALVDGNIFGNQIVADLVSDLGQEDLWPQLK